MAGEASFAALLRRYRRRAGLSQEELAARALVSTRAVSDLERGVNTRPRRHTAVALAEGLGLAGEERSAFERYARPDTEHAGDPGTRVAPRAKAPHPVDSYVDDERLDDLLALVRNPANRLITLIGPGGAGKTRLAVELAHRLDGIVAFVALASLDDPSLLAVTVVNALGAEPGPARSPLESLVEHLGSQTMTLILDNLEQIVDAAADLAAVIRSCPGVTIVATSRVPLHLAGEVRFAVRPLDVARATQLFLERAAAAGFDTARTAEGDAAVTELCRRLDGLPLAIELAAARSGVVAPADVLRHLDQVLDLLSGDRSDAPEHHRSMRAALEWSYRLLPPAAQEAFAALGAFATSVSADAAKAVWGLAPTAAPRFYDLVQILAEAHLVNVDTAPQDELRIDVFEIARQFAGLKLDESDSADLVHERLTQHAVDLVDRAAPALFGPDMLDWLDLLDRELPNLRAVGHRLAARGGDEAVDTNLRLVAGLQRYWDIRSRWYEGAAWLRDALAQPGGSAGARGPARKALAVMHRCVGALDDAEAELDRALDDYAAAGDEAGIASCLNNRAVIALDRARYEQAAGLLRRSLARCEALGGEEALAGVVLNNLGLATLGMGDLRAAFRICRRGHRMLRAQGNLHGLCWVEDNMASVLTLSGHPRWAVAIHERTIRRRIALGDENGFVWSLEALAEAWAHCGETMLAGRALGFVAAHRERLGTIPVPMFHEQAERRRAAIVARVGAERFGELWDEGSRLPAETVRGWFDG